MGGNVGCCLWCIQSGSYISRGADDSEMPKIDLDEEEQDSFWESTWKMFKEYCSQNPMTVVVSAVLSFGHTILKKFLLWSTE